MNLVSNNTTHSINLISLHVPSLRLLIIFSCIFIYIFGYTGCFLSIMTFSSKKLRHHSTGFLFLIMAFVDILNLFASLQYFLDVLYQINVFSLSIHWCRFFTIFNYELYFGFSWIFTFISLDRWIKVEWPTKSQSWCTRQNYVYLCSISFLGSLIQNIIYALICFDDKCNQKTFLCEIMIHIIYISFYMTVPIGVIILSISRTFLISINLRKRFRNPTNSVNNQTTMITTATTTTMTTTTTTTTLKLDSIARRNSPSGGSRLSNSFLSSLSSSGNGNQSIHTPTTITRRRARIDTQMIVLISINVAPFILVHIITEIAYLFERYSTFVGQSNVARLSIIFVYLSWYLISATRFYTNCLLSRIYREEFKHRLRIFRRTCFNDRPTRRRVSSRLFMATSLANGIESSTVNHNQLQI